MGADKILVTGSVAPMAASVVGVVGDVVATAVAGGWGGDCCGVRCRGNNLKPAWR